MAKFTSQNVEFKDGQKAIFGTDDDSSIFWSANHNHLVISTVVSGIEPIQPGHLVTKRYVDELLNYITGVIIASVNIDGGIANTIYGGTTGKDGGASNTVYGGTSSIDGGNAATNY
jgi:hypothetical protein